MRTKVKCDKCGGEFYRTQPDGTEYVHSCPPEPETQDESAAHESEA